MAESAAISASSPKDRRLDLSMGLLGFGLLLPFNFVLNAIPYFEAALGGDIAYTISVSFTTPQLLMQPIMLMAGHLTRPLTRLMGVAGMQALTMSLSPIVGVQSRSWNALIMAAAGCGTSIMESSVFGFASSLPSSATNALMIGEGLAGLSSSVAQLCVKAVIPDSPGQAAALYFGLAALTMVSCAATAWWLRKNATVASRGANAKKDPFAQLAPAATNTVGTACDVASKAAAHAPTASNPLAACDATTTDFAPLDSPPANPGRSGEGMHHRPVEEGRATSVIAAADGLADSKDPSGKHQQLDLQPSPTNDGTLRSSPHAAVAFASGSHDEPAGSRSDASLHSFSAVAGWLRGVWRVLRHIWPATLAVLVNFVGTFLIIPGVIASIPYRGASEMVRADTGWWTVTLFLIFSLGDLAGRLLAGYTPRLSGRAVLVYAVAKVAVVPIVMGSARGWSGLASDAVAGASVGFAALLNGHCATLAMVEAPRGVEARDKELAGFISVLGLHTGISLGSVLALGLEAPSA
jgi:hypothetical protein